MADSKITALTALTAADPVNDMFPVVDVSDTSMAASGTTKRISANNILSSSPTASGALTVTGLVTAGSATITGNLTVDSNTLVVTASTDTVCIGTTTTDAKFRILDASGNGVRIGFLPGTSNYNLYDATTHEFRAVNGSNSFGGINANGIGLGRIPAASGIGVAFLAAQSASSDANTLDDYEEGTWTPSIGGTATYTTQNGRYVKIGNRVYVTLRLTILLRGTGSTSAISGIPFAVGASSPICSASIGYFADLAISINYISAYANSSSITLTGTTSATTSVTNAVAVIGNGTDIAMSFFYEV